MCAYVCSSQGPHDPCPTLSLGFVPRKALVHCPFHRGSLRDCYVIFVIVMLFCVRGTLASEKKGWGMSRLVV